MNSLQNDFLKRSVAALENLANRAKNEAVLSPEFVREAFRILHTIKGTSQTFGFSSSSKIAHQLETLLSDGDLSKENLREGLAYLIDSFTKTVGFEIKSQSKNNRSITPQLVNFEAEFLNQFSEHEKKKIISESNKGNKIFLVNASFDLDNFTEDFKNLREKLSEKGEIIATLPNQNANGKIGFQLCFASNKTKHNLKDFSAEIIEQKPLPQNDLDKLLSQIIAHGKGLAKELGKEIEFELAAEKIELAAEKSKLIFDILLHLTRNAIDHAFEKKGKVKISIKLAENGLKLFVKDNGKGVDAEKIRAKAIEKKLISPAKTLTESEMLDLIFLHDFSTAEILTEISGRGVGLDAVKNLVENACGTINVKSRRESGTIFEVFLRYEE